MPNWCLSNRNCKTLVKMFAFCSSSSDEPLSDFIWNEHMNPLLKELSLDGSIIPPNRTIGEPLRVTVDHVPKEEKIHNPDDKLLSTVVRQYYNHLVEAKVVEAGVNPKNSLKWRWTGFLSFKRCNH